MSEQNTPSLHPLGNLPWRVIGWSAAAALLALPLVAMQRSAEIRWSVSDFVFAALLIGTVGGAVELAVRNATDRAGLAGFVVALSASFLMIWVNSAVGIIGSADNDANWLYVLVLSIGLVMALAGRFRPRAMCRALVAVLLAQAVVTAIALLLGLGQPEQSAFHLIAINGLFMAFWSTAAVLFIRSAGFRSEREST